MEFKQFKQYRLPGYDYSHAGDYFITICIQNREPLFGSIENDILIPSGIALIAEEELFKMPEKYPCCEIDEWIIMPDHMHLILRLNDVGTRRGVITPNETEINDVGTCLGMFSPNDKKINGVGTRHGVDKPNETEIINDRTRHGVDKPNETEIINDRTRRGVFLHEKNISTQSIDKTTYLRPLQKNSVSSIINHFKGAVTKACNKNGFEYFKWQSRFHDKIIRDDKMYYAIKKYIQDNPLNWNHDKW